MEQVKETQKPNAIRKALKKLNQALMSALLLENEWHLYNVAGDNPHTAARVKAEEAYNHAKAQQTSPF
jgi:hypothetical protein